MYVITQRYNDLVMGGHENLSMYLTSSKSALTAVQQAYEMAGREGIDELYPEGQMAAKFILGLNNSYNEFNSVFTNGLKPWPDCTIQNEQHPTHQQGWSVRTHSR